MVKWILNKKIAKNPEPIKTLGNNSHPLVRKYKYMFPPEENQDLE